jgi:ribosomal protein S18 acetylase RimI-like enzyme
MGKITIRPAAPQDATEIATIHVRTWQHAYRGQIPDDYLDSLSILERTERWQRILANPGLQEQTFVAEIDGTLVGFCSVGKSRNEGTDATVGELYALYVAPHPMNKGAGSALVEAGKVYLIEQGFKSATLWVLETNQNARQFYESKGWRADGTKFTEERPGFVLHELRYAVSLTDY